MATYKPSTVGYKAKALSVPKNFSSESIPHSITIMCKTESDIIRIKAKWSHHQQYIRPKIIWWNEINKISEK